MGHQGERGRKRESSSFFRCRSRTSIDRRSLGGQHLRVLPSSLSQMSFRGSRWPRLSRVNSRKETVNLNTCCPATLEEKTWNKRRSRYFCLLLEYNKCRRKRTTIVQLDCINLENWKRWGKEFSRVGKEKCKAKTRRKIPSNVLKFGLKNGKSVSPIHRTARRSVESGQSREYVRDNRNGRIAAISIGFLFPVPREGVVSESKGK